MIEWLTGANGDWVGIAIAVGIVLVVAYAVASLAGRLARRALAGFAPADGDAGATGPSRMRCAPVTGSARCG